MSIQTLARRVSEVESILDSLSVTRTSQAAAGVQKPDAVADAVGPFPLLLNQKLGLAKIQGVADAPSAALPALADRYAKANGLDPALVRAVIKTESNWDAGQVSSKGAKGLMQLMPEDCVAYGVKNPLDPEQNIAAGTKQLADKLKQQGGDLDLALAAYNAGSGAVHHYKGVPPYTETQNYIRKIRALLGQ